MFKSRRYLFLLIPVLWSLNLFSQQSNKDVSSYIVSEIIIEGNTITKEKIIYRELLFQVGDTIPDSDLEKIILKSKENLLNTSLFNFVTIETIPDSGYIRIVIILQERWYVWPYPILEQADRNVSSFLRNQEWSRIDYGLYVLINNFRGRKEILKLKTIFGYNNSFILFYKIPYIDKRQKIGAGIDIIYTRNHEIPYQISSDELQYVKLTNRFARETIKLSNFYTYRPQLYTNHLLNLKYTHVALNDSVLFLNSVYFYDNKKEVSYLTIGYNFDYDKRDSKIYPLNGYRFFFSATKNGLGILSDKGNTVLQTSVEENYKIVNRLFMNTSILGQLNLNNFKSFYFSEAIGYKNYLRGMEYYVTNGTSYYISKTNFKFELFPQTKFDLKFIPTDKFSKIHLALYVNLFFDTGYVDSDYTFSNSITNEWLYTGGVGLDLVTYYDKVLRFEYSLNKFGEHGIFFHLGAPINVTN